MAGNPLRSFDAGGNPNPNYPFGAPQTNTLDVTAAIEANPLGYENSQITAQDTAIQQQYQSAASQLTQQGDVAEEGLFGNAADVAHSNALLSITAGDIAQAQSQLSLRKTLGAQQAGIASAGFAQSGSALNLFRASTQQGHLEQQLDVTNAQAKAGGFYAQEAAARAQGSAAGTAGQVAGVTSTAASTLAASNQTRAVNEATQIAQAAQAKGTPIDPHTGQPSPTSSLAPSFDPTTGQPVAPTPQTTIYNTQTGAPTQVPGNTIPAALPTTANIISGAAVPAGGAS